MNTRDQHVKHALHFVNEQRKRISESYKWFLLIKLRIACKFLIFRFFIQRIPQTQRGSRSPWEDAKRQERWIIKPPNINTTWWQYIKLKSWNTLSEVSQLYPNSPASYLSLCWSQKVCSSHETIDRDQWSFSRELMNPELTYHHRSDGHRTKCK